jgi:phosphonate transport system substrate-binding protein
MKRSLKSLIAGAAMLLGATTVTADEPLRFAVTDIVGVEMLQVEFGAFREKLAEVTGREIEFTPVSSRTAAVEALNSEQIDFVLTGPAEYIVINKLSDASPVIGFSRPDYFSAVIVLSDSDYQSPADLIGQRVAFGDIGSTSNHLAPAQALADNGVTMDDIEEIHTSANIAWEALKSGDVAAIGMNHGKFVSIRDGDDTIEPGAFRVIARGPDLPNDLLVAGAHVDPAVVEAVRIAIAANSDALVTAILAGEDNKKYAGMRFLPDVDDSDYDYVRSMYATIGYPEFAGFVGE